MDVKLLLRAHERDFGPRVLCRMRLYAHRPGQTRDVVAAMTHPPHLHFGTQGQRNGSRIGQYAYQPQHQSRQPTGRSRTFASKDPSFQSIKTRGHHTSVCCDREKGEWKTLRTTRQSFYSSLS